jgi:YggT family protein
MTALLLTFIQMLTMVLWLLMIARVVLSWTNPMGGGGGLVAFVYQVTEPILAPIRRVLPQTPGIDWSPLIAMLLLSVILRLVGGLSRLG